MRFHFTAIGIAFAFAMVACNKDTAKTLESSTASQPESVTTAPVEVPTNDDSPAIGEKAPSITVASFKNSDEEITNLDAYLGQVVILDFWAYW